MSGVRKTVDESSIAELRGDLDECDRQLAWLLARRSRTVAAIAAIKGIRGMPPRDPAREELVLEAAVRRQRSCDGRYSQETIHAVYATIFAGCEQLKGPLADEQAAVPSPVDGRDRRPTGY